MDHVATSKLCSSFHPSGTRHKHSCASSRDVCDGNCSVHACEGDVWEVSQAQDLLTVEAGTSPSPQTQAWDFPFRSPNKPFFGRHPPPLQTTGSENFCRAEPRYNQVYKHSKKSAVLCSTVPTIMEISLQEL